jgi:hypothetical protein
MAHPKSCAAVASRHALNADGSRIRGGVAMANVRTALPAALVAGSALLPGRS